MSERPNAEQRLVEGVQDMAKALEGKPYPDCEWCNGTGVVESVYIAGIINSISYCECRGTIDRHEVMCKRCGDDITGGKQCFCDVSYG